MKGGNCVHNVILVIPLSASMRPPFMKGGNNSFFLDLMKPLFASMRPPFMKGGNVLFLEPATLIFRSFNEAALHEGRKYVQTWKTPEL